MKQNDISYPIGKFEKPEFVSEEVLSEWIEVIGEFPEKLNNEVNLLNSEQLDTPYREGGWTIRQLVHHCADSHLNAFLRFKLALTENNPTVKTYDQDAWAELADTKSFPIESSLEILRGLHKRWSTLLRSLEQNEINKTYNHPDFEKALKLEEAIGMYAWHCNHHLAHIKGLKSRMSWD